jgi:hypothetical protein
VQGDRVSFRVRQNEVGDFLATMAVLEQGGSSVRSASFPLKIDDPQEDQPDEPQGPFLKPLGAPPAKEKNPDHLVVVSLDLDGKEHDLQVGYVAETPVWRPSYRLVVQPAGQADLQAWGIVQNLSGEDWRGVQLSLVAGAPLAFQPTLGTPVIPTRPTVTDSGEVIGALPQSETSLMQTAPAPPPPPEPAARPAPARRAREEMQKNRSKDSKKKVAAGRAPRPSAAGPMGGAMKEEAAYDMPTTDSDGEWQPPAEQPRRPGGSISAPRSLSALAAVAMEGSTTRYDIPTPVTVPDKSATMVLLLSTRVPGESNFLFAPAPGVPDSQSHPFRVARFTNQTNGLLERGPIAVFDGGAFLGQGMVDPLPPGATATVPFALERALAIDSESQTGEEGSRLARIESGDISIERDYQFKTKYRVRNGGDRPAKVLIKHTRRGGTRLFDPPKGTEDNVGMASALVPTEVAPGSTGELVVDERMNTSRNVDWLSTLADEAVRGYMADSRADQAVVAALRKAWEVRPTLIKATEEERRLRDESAELSRDNAETRENLKSIEKNPTAGELRKQLTDRLAKAATRLNEITKRLVEVRLSINEQRVRFLETVRGIKMLKPLPAPVAP